VKGVLGRDDLRYRHITVSTGRLSWRPIGQWLKQEWRRTPIVGVITLLVAIAAATFGYWNYRLQIGRPDVEPMTAYLWQISKENCTAVSNG
jgi:hypothetical protein